MKLVKIKNKKNLFLNRLLKFKMTTQACYKNYKNNLKKMNFLIHKI